jgi:PAS domain S-box-containing protein
MPADPKDIRALRRKAEKLLSEAPEKLALTSGRDLERLVHELSVHQIELEMQNEELRRSREQLEESRSEYADLYDFAPVGYLTFDKMGLVTRANLTATRLLGIERSLLVKKPFALFVHPESQDLFHFHTQKVFETTTTQTCRLVLNRKDGTFFDAQLESIAVQANGTTAIRAILTDITERTRAGKALQESDNRLKLALTSSHTGVWEWNVATNELFWSPECYEILGTKDIGGTLESLRKLIQPEDFLRVMDKIRQVSMDHPMLRAEFRIIRPDGGVRWLTNTGQGYFDGAGALLRMIGTVLDISEQKQAEEALNQANRRLTEAKSEVDRIVEERTSELTRAYESLRVETGELQRAEARLRQAHKMETVGTLASGIAHDFNNILAAIIGFSEMARDKTPEESPARGHMERVFAAGIRGKDLVKQILAFSRRAEQAKLQLKLAPVVKEALGLIRASLPSTVDIRTNLPSNLGFVLADPIQMQQIVMNLCTNAAHAMRRRGGSISIDLADFSFSSAEDAPDPTMSPGSYSRLSVTDTGEGMSPETIEHIFDPFFTTKAEGEGTGLGLSVVHGIVTNHGGQITVSSQPGKGSIFTVYLPKLIEEQSRDSGDGGSSIPRGHERILFIDDEKDLIAMGDEMLTDLGYHVTCRTGAREVLALFRLDPSRFDLVITDQTMPEMTGKELVEEILAIRADMPIIMCTGFSPLVDADNAKASGVRAFALKPLTKTEIATTIRRVLDE